MVCVCGVWCVDVCMWCVYVVCVCDGVWYMDVHVWMCVWMCVWI